MALSAGSISTETFISNDGNTYLWTTNMDSSNTVTNTGTNCITNKGIVISE